MDLNEILAKSIINKLVANSIDHIVKLFNNNSERTYLKAKKKLSELEYDIFLTVHGIEISESLILSKFKENISSTIIWSSHINIAQALQSKELSKIFVELDLYLSQLKVRIDKFEETRKVKQSHILKKFNSNKIIYGSVGSGKTTFVKKICLDFIASCDFSVFSSIFTIQFRLLEYRNKSKILKFGLFGILSDIFCIKYNFYDKRSDLFEDDYFNIVKDTIIALLDENRILFVADGFDEIPDLEIKKRIAKDFQTLGLNLVNSRFILSSRNNDFDDLITNTDRFEICPLNDNQIKKIISKWIRKKEDRQSLYTKIKSSPFFDTTMKPLTLSNLCAIYERRKNLPTKPKWIYAYIIELLIENWDREKGVNRTSTYSDFYIEKKKEFLYNIAFLLTTKIRKDTFSKNEIKLCIKIIANVYGFKLSELDTILSDIESHSGLIQQVSYNSLEFSHKSLQEYLSAKYIDSLPHSPESKLLRTIPNECAIAASLSSSPNFYFEKFIKDWNEFDHTYWPIFFGRLIEELPDFTENPSVIVFILTVEGNWMMRGESIANILKKLFEKTNLRISLPTFHKIYHKEDLGEEIIYRYSKKSSSLKDRKYFPKELKVSQEIASLIEDI